jgi:nucleotide-binding universal stress UspA family protein
MQNKNVTRYERLIHPRKIVVATDLSDGERLLPLAIAQARASQAQLTLLHADLVSILAQGNELQPVIPSEGQAEAAEKMLTELAAKMRSQGVSCEAVVCPGLSAAEVLLEEVARIGADRLIMATHGRGRIGQMMLGSVAKRVLKVLGIPIFVVGPNVQSAERCAVPKRILHPVSLAGKYQDAVEVVRGIAELYGAELVLMHVLGPDSEENVNPRRTIEWAKHALDVAIEDRVSLTVNLLTHVAFGSVTDEVLESAERFQADWIVLGLNEKSHRPLLVESTAYKVIAAAKVPVLAMHHPQPKATQARRNVEVPSVIA